MVSKRPFFEQSWGPSEQPHRPNVNKRALRLASLPEYMVGAASLLVAIPVIGAGLFARRSVPRTPAPSARDFLGVSVSPCTRFGNELPAVVNELGAKRLMLRVPVWHRDRFSDYRRFADCFPDCDIVVSIIQDRGSVCRLASWRADLTAIFSAFAGRVTHFQLPIAPNRSKWGCINMGDALDLLEVAHDLRQQFPWIRLIGPGVIDFEPLPFVRGLINNRRYQLDVISSFLYVDRRGSPTNTQYGIFDLAMKIRTLRAIADASPRCRARRQTPMWITEFNWPLKDTGDWSPTACDEQVDEETAALHLRDYCKVAYQTGLVQRLYWWQLVHPGYGLIDSRENHLRRRPTFDMAQRILHGEESLSAPVTAQETKQVESASVETTAAATKPTTTAIAKTGTQKNTILHSFIIFACDAMSDMTCICGGQLGLGLV